jgi:hypothetical protein
MELKLECPGQQSFSTTVVPVDGCVRSNGIVSSIPDVNIIIVCTCTSNQYSSSPLATPAGMPHLTVPMFVVFGRPGAGKTTVADNAADKVRQWQHKNVNNRIKSMGLDLDVCISERMREDFARGIYPTLDQRLQFGQQACDYVEGMINRELQKKEAGQKKPE